MRTFRRAAVIPFALSGLLLTACGDDSGSAATSTTSDASTTTVAASTTVTPTTTPPTNPPSTTTPPSTTIEQGPRQIDVLIGTDDSPTRIETVPLGSDVTINITNPTAADEYHLHGYDIELKAKAGRMAVFNFVANRAGQFEVESHETGDVLFILDVV
jgi:hypothetical protein